MLSSVCCVVVLCVLLSSTCWFVVLYMLCCCPLIVVLLSSTCCFVVLFMLFCVLGFVVIYILCCCPACVVILSSMSGFVVHCTCPPRSTELGRGSSPLRTTRSCRHTGTLGRSLYLSTAWSSDRQAGG